MKRHITHLWLRWALLLCWLPCTVLAAPSSRPTKQMHSAPTTQKAAAALFQHPIAPKAPGHAFQQVTKQLTHAKILRARFTQRKQLKALRFPLRSNGHFLFAHQRGIAWQFKTPFQASFVVTGQAIIQRAHGKVTKISGKRRPVVMVFTRMFFTIFQGKASQLHKHFHVFFQGTAKAWQMGLRPKDKLLQKIFRQIVLHGGRTIEQVELAERSGDHTHLRFSHINTTPLTPQERKHFATQ